MIFINTMRVSGINFENKFNQNCQGQYLCADKPIILNKFCSNHLNSQTDKFEKVAFTGVESSVPNKFETTFTRQFFKKLLREGIPDAYSDRTLIPLEDIDALKKSNVLNKKGFVAIKSLKPYEENMFPTEKEVFTVLENLSKSQPKLTLQQLLLKSNQPEILSQLSDSASAFVVKYSQPYKIKTFENGVQKKIRIDSQEIGIRLLENSVGTDDHIYPKAKYFVKTSAEVGNNFDYDDSIDFRVTVLTSKKLNNEKSDVLLDDFINNNDPKIPLYIQKQVDKLLEIEQKWEKQGKIQDALTLADYVVVLRDEFAKRSEIVKVDIGDVEVKIPKLQQKVSAQLEKKNAKRFNK